MLRRRRRELPLVRIEVVDLRPDDVVILEVDQRLSREVADRLRDGWAALGVANRIIVLEQARLRVLRPGEAA